MPFPKHLSRRTMRLSVVSVAAVGMLAVYVSLDLQGNRADAACEAAADRAAVLDPFVIGEMAAFRLLGEPARPAGIAFEQADGTAVTIDDFAGRVVLLNLWATWCVPCREEMPALDRLARETAGEDFAVVAVSVDTVDLPERPRAFLEDEIGAEALPLYVDPELNMLRGIRRLGLLGGVPTSLLFDEEGCVVGVLEGPADWASPDAVALIGAALAS